MQIKRKDFRGIAINFLLILEREKIHTLEDIKKRVGESFPGSDGVVFIQRVPLNLYSDKYILKYSMNCTGNPIELSMFSPPARHSTLAIKFEDLLLDGYKPYLFEQATGNYMQTKTLHDAGLSHWKEEIKGLCALLDGKNNKV